MCCAVSQTALVARISALAEIENTAEGGISNARRRREWPITRGHKISSLHRALLSYTYILGWLVLSYEETPTIKGRGT